MELIIRNTTNQPIYDQIYAQIKAQIIAGELAPGEALPSTWTPPWSWPPSAASLRQNSTRCSASC